MKKAMWSVGLVCTLVLAFASVQAQPCAAAADCPEADAALEQLMLLQISKELDLYPDEIIQVLEGHEQYRDVMDGIDSKAAALKAELQAAIDAGNASAASSAMSALMDLEEQKLSAQHAAVAEVGTLLDKVSQAKVYLLIVDLEANKAELRQKLSGGAAVCPMQAAAAATTAAAPAAAADPQAGIMTTVKAWTDGLIAQDIDAAMATFSENFEHYEYGDKAGVKDFIGQAIDMGYLEGLEVELEDAEVELDGGEATVYPIELMGAFGSVTFELVLTQEGGAWKVTGMDASGI